MMAGEMNEVAEVGDPKSRSMKTFPVHSGGFLSPLLKAVQVVNIARRRV